MCFIMSVNVSLTSSHLNTFGVSYENNEGYIEPPHDNVESHFPFSLCQNSTKAANCTIYSLRLHVSPHSMDE